MLQRIERAANGEAAPAPIDPSAPLTPQEVSELKRQLAFLRDYRKTLKLKLNAQEDLLLNGAREPDDRGVCHHLLSKVDYATVQRAVEKLPTADRPRLVGGVLDFKPELAFLLLYLESLKEAGHGEATRALEGALERIDYANVSEGQMRRVLDLIVELFPESRRGSLLLGLLANRSFQAAFDQSLAKLPAALSELVAPVRALQAVVLEGRPNPTNDAMLASGLELVLKDGLASFERRPPRTRARLVEVLCRKAPTLLDPHFGTVQRLLGAFDSASPERRQLELAVVRALLGLGRSERAARRLNELGRSFPNDAELAELDRILKAPRFGRFALLRGGNNPPVEHLNEGVELSNQRPVWLRVVTAQAKDRAASALALTRELPVYGVARVIAAEESAERDVVALERRGEALVPGHALFRQRHTALDVARQLVGLYRALAASGRALPDAGSRRFEVVGTQALEALHLVNTWELTQCDPVAAATQMLPLVRQLPFLGRHLSPSESARLAQVSDFAALEQVLDELRWG